MNTHTRRRDDRSAADPFKQWVPADSKYPHDYDPDRRRNRSATVPSYSYDPRSYPPQDSRYNDPRQPSRSHRQDPHYLPAAPYSSSYHHSSAQAPSSTSRAYQHATRASAQPTSSGYHYPQPTSHHQPSHSTSAYPPASSSRRPHPETSDSRPSRRPPPPHQPYEQLSSGEEMARASKHTSRPPHTSAQPAPSNQTFWIPPQETSSSRRHKDPYRDRDREQERERDKERERERDKPAEVDIRYKDRTKSERHRERDRERERVVDVRHQEPSRSRYHDRRKDSDTEGALYSDQRNASKASLSGREGHSSTVRDPSSNHRRHRTEDGTASTGRRQQPESTQNPITTMPSHSISMPQPDVQHTGEPPPAPRVMPVYLPPKAKPQRAQREGRPSTAQGAQSGSDTERATAKHRMERTPSGPAVQRSDAHASGSARDRGNHEMASRDDVRKFEGKYGVHQDARQPAAPANVDIPLVTPGFNSFPLPTEPRTAVVQQIVSIRAGQGPSDPHDAHFKSSAVSHSDVPQDIEIRPPHPISASIVKPSSHTRLQSSEMRAPLDRPVGVEHSRPEPRVDELPPGERMSIHESSRALSTSNSKSYVRGNPDTGVDNTSPSFPHSRPPSRSAHRSSSNYVVPAVVGPRPLRSISQGQQANEPPTRPQSVAQHVSTASYIPNQSPSPTHPTNGSPSRVSHQPSPKNAQLHGVTLSHSTSTQQQPSAPPSAHPTPLLVSQTFASSSRPSTRDGVYTDAPSAYQQSANRQSTADLRPGSRQTSTSTTVEASWVVQTATPKKGKTSTSREDKYLRDHRFNTETAHAQLRQVLSQDDDGLYPRPSSSMMKASQVTTPTTSSQRNSLGAKARDVAFGTPRGTSANNSPKPGSAKEAPTPDQIPRQHLLPHLAGPPQIAVVGATPVTVARDLPQGRVDHALLAPPFPAPTRASRTASSSQDQVSQPVQPTVRSTSSSSYQSPLAPAVHAPSLFQPYHPPSLSTSEDNGQSSPPPIPVPPPRSLEDSPPPPIETRTSEIIPTRSQSNEHTVPEVQSEMFHLPSQPRPPPPSPPRATQSLQPGKLDGNVVLMPTSNEPVALAQADAKSSKLVPSQPVNIPVVHQEIMLSVPVFPAQSFPAPPARPRPKVTIEDVSDDSPVLSKPVTVTAPSVPESRPVQNSVSANANTASQPIVADQPTHKYSPQSRSKDPIGPAAPPMPPPFSTAVPMSTRVYSAPATQTTFPPTTQAAAAQRVTFNSTPSRPSHRTGEILQASKLSTTAATNPSATGSINKFAVPSGQTVYSTTGTTAISQHQPVNGVNVQPPLSSKPISAVPSISAPTSTIKTTTQSTAISSGPVGTLGPQISVLSTNILNTQASFAPDAIRQLPGRLGPLAIPSVDAAPMTTAVKNVYQEQPVVDPTRLRDAPSVIRNIPPTHVYPTSARPTASTTTQHTHVASAQPSTHHHRVVPLPTTSLSSAAQKPPSPRKYPLPIPSATVSTQPFPTRPPAPEPQPARVPVSAHVYTPAPVRSARLPPPDRMNDFDMLKTPSSIAPSPMLNPDMSNFVPQSMAIPVRERLSSTDSKDEKKKPSGLFGIFRTRTLSSKAADPSAISAVTRASLDQGRVHPDVPVVVPSATTAPRGVSSTSAPRELNSTMPLVTSQMGPQSKFKGRVPGIMPGPPTQAIREQRDTPHIFTPFKFLSMHSKRNRTVSAASLDVCDGNTATNTVIGSPDHSTVSQAQPLPPIIPPDVRDPLVAASEWRDREEAERKERRNHRIRRPGVTFDVEEEPPSPAPGAASRRKRLVRRGSGRTPTPGPLRI